MYNLFTKHPNEVNETYIEHMICAFKFHCILLRLSSAVLIHAIFPFWFETTASDGIKKLNDYIQNRR